MASLLLKNVPEHIRTALKEAAARSRRSMTQQALVILEQALRPLPPIKPRRPFTHEWLLRAMREGRE